MTFIYELDPYPLELCQMAINELYTSRLSKVTLLHADMPPKLVTNHSVSGNK